MIERFRKSFGIARGWATAASQPQEQAVPDFTLSGTVVTTAWGVVSVGDLIPINAPAGVQFRLRDEDAGFAVVNG